MNSSLGAAHGRCKTPKRDPPFLEPKATHAAVPTEPTVRIAYDFLDRVLPAAQFFDLTDGIYDGDPATPYELAQQRQLSYLLDEAGCHAPGFRLLDIGCGNGTLLDLAEQRGAQATGITISPAQWRRCRDLKLDVRLLNYRNIDLDGEWRGRFDGIVANGSAEHFVQPRDAAAGRADGIYRRMFAICHRLIDPASPWGRFVTTVIHFGNVRLTPRDFMRHPFRHRWGSPAFHAAMLNWTLGGYYPVEKQLETCASSYFSLLKEVDGTTDYRLTSEEWLRRMHPAFFSRLGGPRTWFRLAPFLLRHPHQSLLLMLLVATESWQWQFRGQDPPAKLLRQTWQRLPAGAQAAR